MCLKVRSKNYSPLNILPPGKNNFEIINKLIYSDGKIIRSSQPAMPTEDCLFQVQDEKPFKIFSLSGKKGLLAIINAADAESVSGSFSPSDVYGLEGEQFVVYDYFNKSLKVAGIKEPLPVSLQRMGHQLYFIIPVKNNFASIGLINKYNAPSTIINETIDGEKATIELYEGGKFAAYMAKVPKGVLLGDQKLIYTYKDGLLEVEVPLQQKKLSILF